MIYENKNIFFTSDFHVSHDNILKFDGRPFKNVNEMNEALIQNWNSVVGVDDIVYYLGDISWGNEATTKWFVSQLQGKIHFIMGNHDRMKKIASLNRFESIHEYGTEISIKDSDANRGYQQIIMSHYAILNWNKAHYGSWMIHGHSHGSLVKNPEFNWYYKRKVIDAGCNLWDYTPISYTQLKEIMKNKEVVAVDHHRGEK